MSDIVVGIDLGATKIGLGLIDPDNHLLATHRLPTNASDGPHSALERIAQTIDEFKTRLPAGQHIAAVGVCCPGPLDHQTGVIFDPPNLTGWRNVPFRDMLSSRLNLPVSLEHDAKAAALGEFYYGSGRGEQNMVYIVVGTGVGAAFMVNGQLWRGMHNSAGEVGGITIDRQGDKCSSGIGGCVQAYTCGPALARRYERLRAQAEQPIPADAQPTTGAVVAQLAEQGDELARRVMTQAGDALGITVATLAMVLDIELYVIGGSVAKSGNLLLEPARQTVPDYAFDSVAARVRIVPAELGDEGPILGCGWLARQTLAEN